LIFEQLSLPLFDPPTFQELLDRGDLHNLRISVSKRLRSSWYVRILPGNRSRHLFIPPYLNSAPEQVKQCLLEWALLPKAPRSGSRAEIRRRKRDLEALIIRYCKSQVPDFGKGRSVDPVRLEGRVKGCKYDLREVFDFLNKRYFGGVLQSSVRWGQRGSKTSYHTIRTDPQGRKINLVTISGAYDHPAVPRYAIEGIMYHEVSHIAVPAELRNGRRVIHGNAFRRKEKEFSHFEEWRQWERRKLPAIIREQRREKRGKRTFW
jgi:hypothetical protein